MLPQQFVLALHGGLINNRGRHEILCSLYVCESWGLRIFFSFFWDFIYFYRGEWREKERERNIDVWLPLTCPLLVTWSATQACALTGNRTSNSLVRRPALNPLNHTRQGYLFIFREKGREGEREGEKHQCEKHWSVASSLSPDQDRTCNPGMYPEQESNRQPFSLWNDVQPIEPHWSTCQDFLLPSLLGRSPSQAIPKQDWAS